MRVRKCGHSIMHLKVPRLIAGAYPVLQAWRVYVDNEPVDTWVVDARWGRTIVAGNGRMLTCWHAGIGPGDLARTQARFVNLVTHERIPQPHDAGGVR